MIVVVGGNLSLVDLRLDLVSEPSSLEFTDQLFCNIADSGNYTFMHGFVVG